MRSIFLMAYKNIRKKKLQNTLVAIIIGVCALVLATGIGLLQGLDGPVDKMFKDTNASHDVIYFDEGLYNAEELKAWFIEQTNIEGITAFKAYTMNKAISIKGKKMDKILRLTERPVLPQVQDKLLFVEGEKKNCPGAGEIWIPTSFAYDNGLKVGDTINIPTNIGNSPMKLTAIVVDPVSSCSLVGTIRVWVGPGEIENIFGCKNNTEIMGLRYKNINKAESTWKDFEKYLKMPFGGYRVEHQVLKSYYNELLRISASVMIAFSIIVIICAVFVIAFTISNSILGDYKIIGILKSQGFTSGQVQCIYQLQFFLLAFISIPIGICLSYLCINILMSSTLKAIGINGILNMSLIPTFITVIIIFIIITITTYLSSKKACKVKPTYDLKATGSEHISSSAHFVSIMRFKSFSTPFSLAIKQMATYKRQVIFISITLFLTSLIFSGTINSYNSISKLGNNLAYWGFDNTEITFQVLSGDKENVINEIEKDKRVVNLVPWNWFNAAYKNEDGITKIIELQAYGGDMNSIGVINIKGRNPITLDEVSLAVNTSKDMNKEIGDTVELYFKGNKKSFIVTGIYQSMADGGTGVRLQRKVVEQYFKEKDQPMYAVKLIKGVSSKDFDLELKAKYNKKIDAKQTYEVFGSFISTITNNMSYAIMFLLVIFTVITFVIVFNVTLITIYQQKKELGIFKSLGMLNSQIRITIVYKMLISSLIGIIPGIPAGIIIMPKLLNIMLSGQGLVSFPFVVTGIGTIAVVALCITVVLISVWIATRRILQIKLNSLINE